MKAEVAAFLEFRFEKIALIKSDDKKEIWRVKVKATGEDAVMKISESGGVPYDKLKKISHPLFAKIFYCTVDGKVCVEEFVEGELLSKFVESEKFFDEETAENFLLQMCEGLSVIHNQNIIHRDIKPANLIRQADGQIKLIDFDIARIFKADKQRDTKQFGTDGYAAPEQFGHSQTDSRSDIYALGQTLKELLGENYHGRLEKIIAKCTEYDPKRRFQTVDEIKDALINFEVEPLKNFTDYRADENSVAVPKVEVVENKSYGKIFVICAGIILLVGIFYFNSMKEGEIPAEVTQIDEKIFEAEKVDSVEKSHEEKFKFDEIVLPQDTPPPTSLTVTLPPAQVEEPQITLPPNFKPSFPNQEGSTLSNFEPSFPEENTEKNFIRAKYFLNGKQLNDWQDNLFDDEEVTQVTYIPYEVWHNNFYPLTGTLEVKVENFSAESFAPQLEIIFNDDGSIQKKFLSGTILNSGQTYSFNISLNEFRVESLKDSMIGSAELQINILGAAQVIGSSAQLNFIFAQKGFPIPKS